MSSKATTAPWPPGRSIGVEVYETGNIEPSRRMNQSSDSRTVTPMPRTFVIGHSSAG